MTIYLDLVFALNFFFDFLLLLTVNNTLKRNISLYKILGGALVGSISFFFFFFPFSSFLLFFFKIILSSLMCFITFGFKDLKYMIQNMTYFYMTSIVLGGFLYFLNLEFSESHSGFPFVYQSYSIPYIVLVIISPIMLYIYYRERKEVHHYEHFYSVRITFLDGTSKIFQSYLDTGNKLKDPITKKYIVLVQEKLLPKNANSFLYVPYHSLNHQGIIRCLRIQSLELNQKKSKNYLVGISEGDLLKDGVECILNSYCLEELL